MNRHRGGRNGLCILLLSLLAPAIALGHPGGLDKKGGHHCRTNCEKFGLEQEQYHFHDADRPAHHQYSRVVSSDRTAPPEHQYTAVMEMSDREEILSMLSPEVFGTENSVEPVKENVAETLQEVDTDKANFTPRGIKEQPQEYLAQAIMDEPKRLTSFFSRINLIILSLLGIILALVLFLVFRLKN